MNLYIGDGVLLITIIYIKLLLGFVFIEFSDDFALPTCYKCYSIYYSIKRLPPKLR